MIQDGNYYRLTQLGKTYYEAWEMVTEEKDEALLSIVITDVQPNSQLIHVKLKGLDRDAQYNMEVQTDFDERMLSIPDFPGGVQIKSFLDQERKTYSGAALMHGGVTLPWIMGTYPAVQLYFKKV